MIRFCDINSECIENIDVQSDHIVLDELVWERGKAYFNTHTEKDRLLIVDRKCNPLCFAYQDSEANRELRMLRELDEMENAFDFRDIYPDVCGVTIYGCNELAWYFAKYLLKRNIIVNVCDQRGIWEKVGTWKDYGVTSYNYEIWAEGIHQKHLDKKMIGSRSASVEFECINEIYEANIRAGKINNEDGNLQRLLNRLKKEKEIIIRGTGTKAQDALDWLCSNGIDICAFQSDRYNGGRRSLFGRPILRKTEVRKRFQNAVIIECSSKYSAWGFGDVDTYDYEGYERNKRYILLRDYIEVPENNLVHIVKEKNIVLIGDIYLCSRARKWWKHHGIEIGEIKYWDVLEENRNKADRLKLEKIDEARMSENDVYMLLVPSYSNVNFITRKSVESYQVYIEKLKEYGISDYTDYFVDVNKCIYLEDEAIKYKKELCPYGIVLGAIPSHSGNLLIRQTLSGHSSIVMIEEYGWFNNDLFFICIRLAEESADNILELFWAIYEKEVKMEGLIKTFVNREKFDRKMRELLKMQEHFTSQELFVIFHLAYEAMHGREIQMVDNIVIYWEPHRWKRTLVRAFTHWLGSSEVKGVMLNIVRNRCVLAGSFMKSALNLECMVDSWMYVCEYIPKRSYRYWNEYTLKFEELKCAPVETLNRICDWIGISFENSLLETTYHGQAATYDGTITGFDLKPAYNLYEEYFSGFDRMRISLVACSYQKQYGYPYVNCLEFSRRELQELFLKEFRYEKIAAISENRSEGDFWRMQKRVRYLLWLERFAVVMGIELEEEF